MTLPPMIGHHALRQQVDERLAGGRLAHALLLAGPRGVGKRLFADRLALALLSGSTSLDRPSPSVARMVAAGSHPDHRLLSPGADSREIRIEAVREARLALRATPGIAPCRVVLVDAAEDLNPAAANALLKDLEEPVGSTHFLLVAHAPHQLMPTIRSRCQQLRFGPLSSAEMAEFIDAAMPGLEERERAARLEAAAGHPGRLFELDAEALHPLIAAIEAVEARRETPFEFARRFAAASARGSFEALCWLAPRRLADRARRERSALAAWEAVAPLAARAIPQHLDPMPVAFAIGRALAGGPIP